MFIGIFLHANVKFSQSNDYNTSNSKIITAIVSENPIFLVYGGSDVHKFVIISKGKICDSKSQRIAHMKLIENYIF